MTDSGADPGFSEGGFEDKLGGSRGMLPQENFKVWNVRYAISWAFRVNLTEPIDPRSAKEAGWELYFISYKWKGLWLPQ